MLYELSTGTRARVGIEPFFSWARLVRECLVLGFIISYIMMCLHFLTGAAPQTTLVMQPTAGAAANAEPFRLPKGASTCGNRPRVYVQCARTGLYWRLSDRDGVIVADESPPETPFRIEPVSSDESTNASFAIRHLSSLQLISVVPPGDPNAYVLRLGPLRPRSAHELFTVRGASLWSNGVGSLINHRERTAVRAHGNTEPWQPLTVETYSTRVYFRLLPCDDPYAVENALLEMVDRGEGGLPASKPNGAGARSTSRFTPPARKRPAFGPPRAIHKSIRG